jgi:hypothetical protein
MRQGSRHKARAMKGRSSSDADRRAAAAPINKSSSGPTNVAVAREDGDFPRLNLRMEMDVVADEHLVALIEGGQTPVQLGTPMVRTIAAANELSYVGGGAVGPLSAARVQCCVSRSLSRNRWRECRARDGDVPRCRAAHLRCPATPVALPLLCACSVVMCHTRSAVSRRLSSSFRPLVDTVPGR